MKSFVSSSKARIKDKMDKFSLKSKCFESNISKTFSDVRREEDFFDVTLVSDDQQHIAAHKLVLSASSEIFRNILKKNTHSNPMIFLSGFNSKDLNVVLDYIYRGEVKLFQDDLENFLHVAQKLKIEGLIGKGPHYEDDVISEDEAVESHIKNELQDSIEHKIIKTPRKTKTLREKNIVHPTALVNHQSSPIEDLKAVVDELFEKDGEQFICKTCGKVANRNSDIRKHVEIHIEGLSFECQFCGKSFRSRVILKQHKRIHKK